MTPQDRLQALQDFEPTDSHLERAAKIRRFNLLYVYIPIAAGSVIIILAVLSLLYLTFASPSPKTRVTISAVADAVITLWTIPAMLLCAVVPTLWLIAALQLRQRDASPVRGTQFLFWRVGYLVALGSRVVVDLAAKIRRPFIQVNARAAYVSTLGERLLALFKRS